MKTTLLAFAFDLSDTLQIVLEDKVEPSMLLFDETDWFVPGRHLALMGGFETVNLLKAIQEKAYPIFLVTNHPAPLESLFVEETLAFFEDLGIQIPKTHYLGPFDSKAGHSKLQRLGSIASRLKIPKGSVYFFDDTWTHIQEAKKAGFQTIWVQKEADLHEGIRHILV